MECRAARGRVEAVVARQSRPALHGGTARCTGLRRMCVAAPARRTQQAVLALGIVVAGRILGAAGRGSIGGAGVGARHSRVGHKGRSRRRRAFLPGVRRGPFQRRVVAAAAGCRRRAGHRLRRRRRALSVTATHLARRAIKPGAAGGDVTQEERGGAHHAQDQRGARSERYLGALGGLGSHAGLVKHGRGRGSNGCGARRGQGRLARSGLLRPDSAPLHAPAHREVVHGPGPQSPPNPAPRG